MGAPQGISWRAWCIGVAVIVLVFLIALPVRAAPTRPPPGDLWAAQSGANTVTVVWSRLESVSEFRIFESEGGAFKQVSSPRSTADSFTFALQPPWGLRKYGMDVQFEEGGSASEKAIFDPIRVEQAKSAPVPAPVSVSAEQSGPGEVTTRWSEAPNASAYAIGRTVGTGGAVVPAIAGRAAPRVRAALRAQDEDPNGPRADVNGKVLEPTSRMNFPGIPAADQARMKAQAERLWSIFVRNPALNPPIGFDMKPSFAANGIIPRRGEPFVARVGGYIHWYIFVPSLNRVERIKVADHAVVVTTNHLTTVLPHKWEEDADGVMYYEPREVRRVDGYPQYERGVIAVTDSARPLWTPVPLERVLRSELAVARKNLEALKSSEALAASYDPAASLEAWLRDRPKRQREGDRMIRDAKESDPKLAEQMQKAFERSELQTERAMRAMAAHPERGAQPPAVVARNRAQRQQAEQCISTLEKELTELSPAESTAPAYVALAGGPKASPRAGCSVTVAPTFPNAMRIVEPNHGFFDTTRPRTDAQVVFVDFSTLHVDSSRRTDRFLRAYDQLREGMNYRAFAAMTTKR